MKKTSLLLTLIFVAFYIDAQVPQKSDNQLQTRMDSVVHQAIKETLKENQIVGVSIGITLRELTYFYNYGTVEKGKQQLPTRNTIYEIGSVTKTFTGLLLAKTVLEKKADLNDDVRQYLKEDFKNLQYKGQPVRLINLANHTSGLAEDIMPEEIYNLENPTMFDIVNLFKPDSGSLFKETLLKAKPDTFPGSKIIYSNAGMITLGFILKNIYDEPYSNLVRKYITSPLGMNNTDIVSFSTDTSNYTKGYDSDLNIMPHITFQIAGAAGGLKSTTNDMLKYLKKNILEDDKAIALSHKKTVEDKTQAIGLGWQISSDSGKHSALWHDGGEPGFSSYCIIIPKEKIGIICLANTRGIQYEFSQISTRIINKLLE